MDTIFNIIMLLCNICLWGGCIALIVYDYTQTKDKARLFSVFLYAIIVTACIVSLVQKLS